MIGRKHIAVLFIFFSALLPCLSQEQSEWMEQGDLAFKNENYTHAIIYYLRAVTDEVTEDVTITRPYEITPYSKAKKEEEAPANTKNISTAKPKQPAPNLNQPAQLQQYLIHQLAEAYRLNHDYPNAELWYKKSVSSKPPLQYPYDHFWYADALIKNNNCKAALPELEAVFKLGERKNPSLFQQAKIRQQGCRMINDSAYRKKEITISKMDSSINRGSASFSANYFGDNHVLQFTQAGNDAPSMDLKKQDAQSNCDVYTITKTETGWSTPTKMDQTINTDDHEAAGCLSVDKNTYYFTRWSATTNECAIYVSKVRNQQWLLAEKLPENVNVSGFKSMHPFLSKDGGTLYFSSNRPGGAGKMDLWYIKMNDKGKPEGDAINMGPKFNTTEDEITPFVHFQTNTLFFSSSGLPGFGGLDIYKSSYHTDSLWATPKNLGTPINSTKDDAYFVLERNQLHGLLSSDREQCSTCSGSACYKVYSIQKKPNLFQLKGTIYNAENNRPIADVVLSFKDMHGDDAPFFVVTDSTGSFNVPIKEGYDFYVKAQKNGYFGDAYTLSTLELTESKEFSQDFFLSTIPKGEIVIPGIEYEPEKSDLKPESMAILDELVEFLKLNNNLKVEISSHTDERGNDDYNLKLSKERAAVVVKYLILEGIPADRLISEGYGEMQPLVQHAETEQEHQKNRRTVLRTISETEIKADR